MYMWELRQRDLRDPLSTVQPATTMVRIVCMTQSLCPLEWCGARLAGPECDARLGCCRRFDCFPADNKSGDHPDVRLSSERREGERVVD